MKKTDVKKTERSKEFLAEEWLEIVLKGQDKGEGRFCRHGVCSFMGRQPLTFQPVKRKPELEKRFIESRIMESRTMKNRFRGTRNSWFGQEELDSKRNGYGERLRDKTELTEEAEAIEETEMEGQLVQKYQTARWEEAVRHVLLFLRSAGYLAVFCCFGKRMYWRKLSEFLVLWKRKRCEKTVGEGRKGREERKSGRKAEKQ